MSINNFEELILSLKSFDGELSDETIKFCLDNKIEVLEYLINNNNFLYKELSETIIYEIKPMIVQQGDTPTHFTIKTNNFIQIFNTFNSLITTDNKIIWIKKELKEMLSLKNIIFKYNKIFKDCFNKIEQIIDIKVTIFNKKSLHKDIQNLINILPDESIFNRQIIEIQFNGNFQINFIKKFKQWLYQNYSFENLNILS